MSHTIEERWYAFVRPDDDVVEVRQIVVTLTSKLIRPQQGFSLSGTGLLHVQWPRYPKESEYGCPLAMSKEEALADLRARLTRRLEALKLEALRATEALRQLDGELVEKKGRLNTWWEGNKS